MGELRLDPGSVGAQGRGAVEVASQERGHVPAAESAFLGVVSAGLAEVARGETAGSVDLEIDSMYKALTWIVARVADMMEEKGEVVTQRAVLEATGSMILDWGLSVEETGWQGMRVPEEATERAFVQICNDNGFDVVDSSLRERGMRKESP
jgi:hypothetical protein